MAKINVKIFTYSVYVPLAITCYVPTSPRSNFGNEQKKIHLHN